MEKHRNARRKNRKIKFSEDQYVENTYFRDGKAVIPIELEDINDLYMKHDYKKMELSDEICSYIEEIAYMIPINTDIVLEIHSPELREEQKERIMKSIKNNYGIEIDDIDYEIMLANRRSNILIIVGILLLIVNILVDKYIHNSFLSNFLSVVWWVAIWDMIEIQTLDRSESKSQRLNYQQLYDAEIIFVTEKKQ